LKTFVVPQRTQTDPYEDFPSPAVRRGGRSSSVAVG